jgi:hypothetical protein
MKPIITLSLEEYDKLKELREVNKNLNIKIRELEIKIEMLELTACDREILRVMLSNDSTDWLTKKALCSMFVEAEFKKHNIDVNKALHVKWNKEESAVTYSINKIN